MTPSKRPVAVESRERNIRRVSPQRSSVRVRKRPERYRAPSDDLSQPVDFVAAAQFNAILEKLALRVPDTVC
jgi:hypothetical protein